MEGAVEHDDAGPTSDMARDLDRVLDGFGAVVEQSHRLVEVTRGEPGEFLADGYVWLIGD